jgi:hypothetical protein
VTALARAQVASGQDQVATIDHGNLGVDALAARLIGYLDGTRTVPELAARLQADLASGALRPTDDLPAQSAIGSRQALERVCRDLLALFRRYGLLEQSSALLMPGRHGRKKEPCSAMEQDRCR